MNNKSTYFKSSSESEDESDNLKYSYSSGPNLDSDLEKSKSTKSYDPKQILKLYHSKLTDFEREEILKYDQIYFTGNCLIKPENKTQFNNGFDDENGTYLFELEDHIAYRYEILKKLGKGAFSQVLEVYDYKRKTKLALKVIRNKHQFHNQALTEIKILKCLKSADKNDMFNFVKMKSYFKFRNHVCIAFELLTINLYHYLRETKFVGCSQALVRRFCSSIVKSLCALEGLGIVHCDLKLENIVLRSRGRNVIKLIDFGSSCFEAKTYFKYLQSRFYRAPEVILQLKYGLPIDMWTLACIISELSSGRVLFRGKNYLHQLALIMELCGNLPDDFKRSKVYSNEFAQSEYAIKHDTNNPTSAYLQTTTTASSTTALSRVSKSTKLDPNFLYRECKNSKEMCDFVKKCLVLEPDKRMKPKQALEHEFLSFSKEKIKSVISYVEILPKSYLLPVNLIGKRENTASQYIKNLSIN